MRVYVCVCGGGGFYVVAFNAIFSNSELNTKIIFLPNKRNSEEYFHRQHFKREYFQIAY